MIPIENEPHGLNENQESHATRFGSTNKDSEKLSEEDIAQNNLAGNAAGNLDEENPAQANIENLGPEGFLGDFAEPQHDDE